MIPVVPSIGVANSPKGTLLVPAAMTVNVTVIVWGLLVAFGSVTVIVP